MFSYRLAPPFQTTEGSRSRPGRADCGCVLDAPVGKGNRRIAAAPASRCTGCLSERWEPTGRRVAAPHHSRAPLRNDGATASAMWPRKRSTATMISRLQPVSLRPSGVCSPTLGSSTMCSAARKPPDPQSPTTTWTLPRLSKLAAVRGSGAGTPRGAAGLSRERAAAHRQRELAEHQPGRLVGRPRGSRYFTPRRGHATTTRPAGRSRSGPRSGPNVRAGHPPVGGRLLYQHFDDPQDLRSRIVGQTSSIGSGRKRGG